MFYSLTSTRKINGFEQVITSYQKHSPVSTASGSQSAVVGLHTEWRTIIASLDYSEWETGALKWSTMTAIDDHKTDNIPYTNKGADVNITITTTANGAVENTSFKLVNVAQNELVTAIIATYYNMTGRDLSENSVKANTRISNAIFNLHKKESV